ISPYGAQNGLSATLARLTAPGVPDTYQGSEGWNQSLVDPDNRRPVDYPGLSARLEALETAHADDPLGAAVERLGRYQDGDVKLLVSWAALQARRRHPALFQQGGYLPLKTGRFLIAFARQHASGTAVIAAPRLSLSLTREKQPWALGEAWGKRELTLPESGKYRNVLTGEVFSVRGHKLALSRLFAHFPLALLLREESVKKAL
ncbi:MAG: malto-oligosyltrehalose synthase, partial [Deinococcus sp.]